MDQLSSIFYPAGRAAVAIALQRLDVSVAGSSAAAIGISVWGLLLTNLEALPDHCRDSVGDPTAR